jgi:hypothetical protein
MADAMETEKELNKQLEDVVARIDKARRELKALRMSGQESVSLFSKARACV